MEHPFIALFSSFPFSGLCPPPFFHLEMWHLELHRVFQVSVALVFVPKVMILWFPFLSLLLLPLYVVWAKAAHCTDTVSKLSICLLFSRV